jgi:DNA polymerase
MFRTDLFQSTVETQVPPPKPNYMSDGKSHVLHFDVEGRNRVDIKLCGGDLWAQTATIVCLAFAVDDDLINLWRPGEPVPPAFIEAACNPRWIVTAFNAGFERAMMRHVLTPQFGFPEIPLAQYRCTQAAASALALPASLDDIAIALDLIERKDRTGYKLMLKMTKPRRPRKAEDPTKIYWHETPQQLERLREYCQQDVRVERELWQVLYPRRALSDEEQELWRIEQIINTRGFPIDTQLLAAQQRILDTAKPAIESELAAVTEGAVTTHGQTDKLKIWFETQGCPVPDITKKTIGKLLAREDLPAPVRRAAELRQAGAQVNKVAAFANRVAPDGRIRGSLKFCAAGTRRWGGAGVQPQNFRKPRLEPELIEKAAALVLTGDYAQVRAVFPNVLSVIADLGRYMVMTDGVFYGGDYSGIEDRVGAWVAGELWKLEAYAKYDASQNSNDEPYRLLAAKLYGIPVNEVTPQQRQTAKICSLAFQYAGGLGAFRRFEPTRFTDDEVQEFKHKWRTENSHIVSFWKFLEKIVLTAVLKPGRIVHCGDRIRMLCEGRYLFIKLPSGGKLAYPYPRVVNVSGAHGNRPQVVFRDNTQGKWEQCRGGEGFYGGSWFENLIQAISRDILAEALKRLEYAGFCSVLHIHDEVLCEVQQGFGSLGQFHQLLVQAPTWAEGLPIAAPNCWSNNRFRRS